jgi:hypothetical protein
MLITINSSLVLLQKINMIINFNSVISAYNFLSAFEDLHKTIINFVISVCLSVRLSVFLSVRIE